MKCDRVRDAGPSTVAGRVRRRLHSADREPPRGTTCRRHPTSATRQSPIRASSLPSTPSAFRAGLGRCGTIVERHAAGLTRLDAVLGDGDHGDNLVIGFRAVDALLAESAGRDTAGRPPAGGRASAGRGGRRRLGTAVRHGLHRGRVRRRRRPDRSTHRPSPRCSAPRPTGSPAAAVARSATRRSWTRSRRPPTPSRPRSSVARTRRGRGGRGRAPARPGCARRAPHRPARPGASARRAVGRPPRSGVRSRASCCCGALGGR